MSGDLGKGSGSGDSCSFQGLLPGSQERWHASGSRFLATTCRTRGVLGTIGH